MSRGENRIAKIASTVDTRGVIPCKGEARGVFDAALPELPIWHHEAECVLASLDYPRLIEALLPAVTEAGRIALRHAAAGAAAELKADRSPVTAADREGQAVIVAALERLEPRYPVVAEEWSGERPRPPDGTRFFLVDPLDGTRDYIAGFPDYTVNVALIDGGVPVFGMILAPALAELYATTGPGAAGWIELTPDLSLPASGVKMPWRPIRTREPDRGTLVGLVSRSHPNPANEAFLAKLGVTEVRRVGSAYKFCLIARGEADVYARMGETSEWDIAAGHALVRAAGGCVDRLDGRPLRYGNADKGFLNPPFVAGGAARSLLS